ncbi:unnamed protein product [Ilex paraguariensis]|uniref:Flowering time control protein FCA n=1 Tax=Ilex paraguariensis TaxID=185542 RepID=A0ABC8RQ59_9AQUA
MKSVYKRFTPAGCCFIKYATSEEADRAIRALHNQHILPGGVGPIQVRYADGERERLVEFKLFVGSLNKQATEKEVEEIFSPYGRVEDVYLMRDEMRQSRGCGFVKFSLREMALAAINALNGIYTMSGCDQPLTVRFADPKRPRPGESRGGPALGGPGFGPRFQAPGIRPTQNLGEAVHGHIPLNAWQPVSPQNMGPPSNAGIHGFGIQSLPRSGDMAIPSTLGGPFGGPSGVADGSHPGQAASSASTLHQSFTQSLPQVSSVGQQISPLQKSLQSPQLLPSSLQLQPQTLASYPQRQISDASPWQLCQQLPPTAGQPPLSQALPSQQLFGLNGQLSVSQPQVQQSASSAIAHAPLSSNLPHVLSSMANQQQLPAQQQQLLQPQHQSPSSQLAQMISQQKQTLQASFQDCLQHLQMMQPSNQNLTGQQGSQANKQQDTLGQHLIMWGGPALGGPGFGPRFQAPGIRPTQNLGEAVHGHIPLNAWQPVSPQNMGPPSNAGIHGFGIQSLPRSGDMAIPSTLGGPFGGPSGVADGSHPGQAASSASTLHQSFTQSLPQVSSVGQQISPLQKSLQSPQLLPSSLQLQPQTLASYPQRQISDASPWQLCQQLPPTAGQPPLSQALPSQQLFGLNGQLSVSQPQVQQSASSAIAHAPLSSNLPHVLSSMANQQQLPAQQQQLLQPQHQSPSSQLAQMISQQKQTLQASFQDCLQHLQMMQPSNQNLTGQQGSQANKQQLPWPGIVPQTVANTPAIPAVGDVPPATSAVPIANRAVAPAKCNWTEHTSPDGYKYYYNSTTGESKWEKPEELTLYEQQQQKPSVQQPQMLSHPQGLSTQQIPQTQQMQLPVQIQTQLQSQLRHPQQLLPTSQSSSTPGAARRQNIQEFGYTQLPGATSSVNDPARFQQSLQAAQEWMWKNNPAGT